MSEPMMTKRTLRGHACEQQANPSAHGEEPLAPPKTDNWLERNADSITRHGQVIAATGLAGEEFDRI